MTNPCKPQTRFGLETCQDMHEKLKLDARRLEDSGSAYDIFNFVVTANHLYADWIDNCGSQENKSKRESLSAPEKMVMQCIVDLSIGGKHWQMTNKNSLERQVVKSHPERCINDWHAYLCGEQNGVILFFEFGSYRLSIIELKDLVLGYFKWIFEDHNTTHFPADLQNQLELYKTPQD